MRPDSGPPRHKGVLVRWTIEGSNAPALCQTFNIAKFAFGTALYRCPKGNKNHTDGLGFVDCSEEWEVFLGNDFCEYDFGVEVRLLDGTTIQGPGAFGELQNDQQTITEEVSFSYEELCAQFEFTSDRPAQCR